MKNLMYIMYTHHKEILVMQQKNLRKDDLLNWLDRKVLRKEHSQEEKRKFFSIIIEALLKSNKYNLSELSINCYKLKDVIESQIDNIETTIAKNSFTELENKQKLSLN